MADVGKDRVWRVARQRKCRVRIKSKADIETLSRGCQIMRVQVWLKTPCRPLRAIARLRSAQLAQAVRLRGGLQSPQIPYRRWSASASRPLAGHVPQRPI